MTIRVEAIFEDGVLRPVDKVPLYNAERVTLTIEPHEDRLAASAKQERKARSIAEIQERWKDVPGSFADLIIAERGDH
jgi:predicted DNA-binding antitoxin AbrB/MazE fold protein